MKSNLITRTGHDLLVAELKKLWHDERPEITKKVNWAASLGDRSENADYQYNKQLLADKIANKSKPTSILRFPYTITII